MQITQEYCDHILANINSPQHEEVMSNFMNEFLTRYTYLKENPKKIPLSAIKEIKLVYYVLYKYFGCDEMMRELESPDIPEDNKNEMLTLINNLEYVYHNIDKNVMNLDEDREIRDDEIFDEELTDRTKQIYNTLEDMIKDQQDLQNTMKQLNDSLEKLANGLTNVIENNRLNELGEVLIQNENNNPESNHPPPPPSQ